MLKFKVGDRVTVTLPETQPFGPMKERYDGTTATVKEIVVDEKTRKVNYMVLVDGGVLIKKIPKFPWSVKNSMRIFHLLFSEQNLALIENKQKEAA
jgi:ribosomal protein L21E